MVAIADRLSSILDRIDHALVAAGRPARDAQLVAVSKTFSREEIQEAYDAGHRVFGESRLQEALPKLEVLPQDIHWHFIGRVQRNKLKKILENFEVIHGIDSLRLAEAADRIALDLGMRAKVFLQVNIAEEPSKGGFTIADIEGCFQQLMGMAGLDIQGLMAIPPPPSSCDEEGVWFASLKCLRDRLENRHAVLLPCLSMGMSGDFESAIAHGATHVRVGSAIFGDRFSLFSP